MKLNKIELHNFMGIKEFTLAVNGENCRILGRNGSGKSTLFTAFLWVLTGKDIFGKQAENSIKTRLQNGDYLHHLDHEATVTLDIGNREVTLRKVFHEIWTKKRGMATETFTGHETLHFIDGVPKTKKEYDAFVSGIMDENIFKLLTNPTFFNDQLSWQKRRELLLQVCGDISDADVIASDKALAKLPDILKGRSLEDHRKVIAARRAEINKELEKIPVRIDEANRSLPDTSGINQDLIIRELNDMRSHRTGKENELQRIQSGGEIAEKQKRVRELEAQILDIETKHRAENEDKLFVKKRQLQDFKLKSSDVDGKIELSRKQIASNTVTIAHSEDELKALREEWGEVNNEQFVDNTDKTCPACGQDLPEYRVKEVCEIALKAFNQSKADRLERINEKGMKIKAESQKLSEQFDELSKVIFSLAAEKETIQQQITALESEISSATVADISGNAEYVKVREEKGALLLAISDLHSKTNAVADAVKAEINLLSEEITAKERILTQFTASGVTRQRIAELEKQEKALAAEYERLDGELYLTEQFVQTKVKLLTEKINSRFKMARFELFEQQVNGGIAEKCETVYNGVPYGAGLNNGHKILVGLDIINTLSDYFNFAAPVFVDNAESITEPIVMDTQVIQLIARPDDETLRVEIDTQKLREAV